MRFKANAKAVVDTTVPEATMTDTNTDGAVETLEKNFHGLSMGADSVNMSDAQMEAVQRGVSSMRLSH